MGLVPVIPRAFVPSAVLVLYMGASGARRGADPMYAWKVFGTASVGIALGVASKLVPWPSLAVWKARDRIDDQNDADAKLARLASDAVGFGATRTQQLEAVATGRRLLKTRADDSALQSVAGLEATLASARARLADARREPPCQAPLDAESLGLLVDALADTTHSLGALARCLAGVARYLE